MRTSQSVWSNPIVTLPAQTLFFLVLTATTVFCQQPSPSPTPARTGKSYSSAIPTDKPPPSAPQAQSPVTFTDITNASNIKFKRASPLTSMKYLLEAMGSGVAMFDYDNDGRMDLFFANSAALKDPMPATELPDKRDQQYWNRLYRQKDDATFEDVTERAGLKGAGYSTGV